MKSAVGVANFGDILSKILFLSDFQGSVCPAVVDIRQLYLSPLSWCRRLLVSFVVGSCLSVFEADGVVFFFHNYPRARRSSEWFEWLMKTSYEKSKRKFWKSFKSRLGLLGILELHFQVCNRLFREQLVVRLDNCVALDNCSVVQLGFG